LQAYDDLVAAMDSGTTDEEVAELLENFQQAMLPELLGWGPVIGEVVKDLVPDLSNVRSAIHAWNDLIEIAEEIEEGDVLGVVGNSGMLVLDLVGVIPLVGSAVAPVRTALKSGAKGAARALGRTAAGRIAGRWMARRRLAKYLDTATDKLKSKSVEEYFGKVWDDLTPPMQRLLRNRFSFLVGRAGELEMIKRARKAGFEVIDDFGKRKFGLSALKGGRQSRIFDFLTKEDFRKVWGGFFVAPGEKGNLPTGIEIKVNLSEYLLDQELADQFLKDTSKKIAGSEVLRLPAEMIKPEHLADAVDEWMKRPWREPWRRPHGVPRKEVEALVAALQASRNMSVGELFGLVLSYRLSREQLRGQREPQSSPAENAGPAEFFTASP
ncbi:MAG: hypothetical protein OEZ03_08195, partial [Alphaproteobacteria bacterium]|nr:hypothetical protein [Alphaproteobacteria bacterium]